MALTAEQRANRKNHLGGSEVPQLMGFSPYGNAYDLWLLKTGRVQPKERTQSYITAGNLLEKPMLRFLADHLHSVIQDIPSKLEHKVDGTPIVVHMDGIVEKTGEPVEAKTEGVDHPMQLPWGEAGSDEVPEHVCLQAHAHMMALDREICHVPTFLGGRGFGYFFVKRNERLVKLIREQAIKFWEENVLKNVPPEACVPSLSMIRRIRSVEGEPKELSVGKVQAWLDAKEQATAAVKSKEFHHAGLLADLDGNPIGKYTVEEDGKKIERYVTNYHQSRSAYSVEATSFRVLRPKKKP